MIHDVGKNMVMYKVKQKNFSGVSPYLFVGAVVVKFVCLSKYFSFCIFLKDTFSYLKDIVLHGGSLLKIKVKQFLVSLLNL